MLCMAGWIQADDTGQEGKQAGTECTDGEFHRHMQVHSRWSGNRLERDGRWVNELGCVS